MPLKFTKSFTQQEAIPESTIAHVAEILRGGRLHRYNILANESSEVSCLEQEYARWQGARYCLATTSGGQALQIALRATGVKPGDKILANAYTLAPVPGAIFTTGGVPVLVEIDDNWHTSLKDLKDKAQRSGARFFLLSHMRGHIVDMDAIMSICDAFNIQLIEDCAHTMGAKWRGVRSGNFGRVACFSTQTYKHINSGEGGLLTTDDAELAARAVVTSGSYMLYGQHGAIPDESVFQKIRLDSPNCSARMDNIRAALIRPQLKKLEENIVRWNRRYKILEKGFCQAPGLTVVRRKQEEAFVGSSIQFKADGLGLAGIEKFLENCNARGVQIKWFGQNEPVGYTGRYDSWRYLGQPAFLPDTRRILSTTCDMRVPLTFDERDCHTIVAIIQEEAGRSMKQHPPG